MNVHLPFPNNETPVSARIKALQKHSLGVPDQKSSVSNIKLNTTFHVVKIGENH